MNTYKAGPWALQTDPSSNNSPRGGACHHHHHCTDDKGRSREVEGHAGTGAAGGIHTRWSSSSSLPNPCSHCAAEDSGPTGVRVYTRGGGTRDSGQPRAFRAELHAALHRRQQALHSAQAQPAGRGRATRGGAEQAEQAEWGPVGWGGAEWGGASRAGRGVQGWGGAEWGGACRSSPRKGYSRIHLIPHFPTEPHFFVHKNVLAAPSLK